MKRRGRIWLLALILLGVCSGAVIAQAAVLTSQATGRSGARPTAASVTRPGASGVPGYVLTAASSGPVLATTSAVLTQDRENDLWHTSVILSQVGAECPRPASEFWLETTSPNGTIQAASVAREGQGPCRVTVTFKGAPRTMEGASLVLDEAGMVSSLQLTLDRQVTLFDFAIIPAIGGFVLAAALLLVIGFIAGFHEEDGLRITLNEHRFRVKTVSVSQMPQVSLVPVATIVATVLGASTLAGSLFPGVSIGIFLVLTSVVAAVAAGVGSLAFDVLHSLWVRRHAPNEIGVPLALTAGGGQPSFSSLVGASIESAGQLYLASEQENQASEKEIPLPDRVPIPDGSKIEVIKGTSLSFLDGPKILLKGESSLLLSNDEMGLKIGNDTYGLPRRIKAKADTTIEYNEATEPDFVPSGTRAGRRRYGSKQNFKLTLERHNEPQTNMLIALVPVFAVVFGVGAELGVIGLLSINFSDATGFGRFLVAALIAFVAVFVVWYVFWKIQRATSPQPGQLQPGNATSLP